MFAKLLPGTVVLNQDPANPMSGVVIPTPEGEHDYDEFVWVDWANGLICQEQATDVTLTGCLFI
jgi:hypothetical protein